MTTSLFLYLLNFVLIAIEVSMVALLADGFFIKKQSHFHLQLPLFLLIVVVTISVILFETIPLLKLVINVCLYSLWVFLNYHSGFIKSTFSAVLLISFQVVIDSLFIMLSGNVSEHVLTNPSVYYLVCYSAKLFELLSIVLIRTWAKERFNNYSLTWANWLRVLFFPFSTFLISLYLLSIVFAESHLAPQLLVCIFILLASDFMSILLLDYLDRQQTAILDNTVLKQNLKLETEHIQSLQESFANQRKLTHDFENQLAVLHSMAERNAAQEEFAEYLDHILSIEFPVVSFVNTHRTVVDIILNQKFSVAQSKSIEFLQKLDDLSSFPLPDDALVIVLTNLIDNAIEACAKIPAPSPRRILLKMQVTPQSSYLYIENTTAAPVHIHNNQITTTKEDLLSHGYGLKNVYTMLDRHHALYAIDYEENARLFRFSIRLDSK